MIAYSDTTPVTSDDTYTLNAPFVGCDYIVYVSGTFDGCTATVGYVDGSAAFAPFRDSSGAVLSMTGTSAYITISPLSQTLAVEITGSTASTSLILDLVHRKG